MQPTNKPLQNRELINLIKAAWDHDLPAICPHNIPIKRWSKLAHHIAPGAHPHTIENGHWQIGR